MAPLARRALAATVAAWCLVPAGLHAQPRGDAQTLIARWRDLNGVCRGGSGDSPTTMAACRRRDDVGRRLGRLGWCYGRRGEAGYRMDWHRCQANSVRPQ